MSAAPSIPGMRSIKQRNGAWCQEPNKAPADDQEVCVLRDAQFARAINGALAPTFVLSIAMGRNTGARRVSNAVFDAQRMSTVAKEALPP